MTWLDDLTLDTVIVHTKAGTSIKGLKAAVYDDCIVLRDAMVLEPEAQVLLDGEVPVPRENVDFMQVITPHRATASTGASGAASPAATSAAIGAALGGAASA